MRDEEEGGRMGMLEDVRMRGWKGQRQEIISNVWHIIVNKYVSSGIMYVG